MEQFPIEGGYPLVISEKLARIGYEELIVRTQMGLERYVKIPGLFQLEELSLPDTISRATRLQGQSDQYIKIPFDSIPINILDLQLQETLAMQYSGLVSTLQKSIDATKEQNPQFLDLLRKNDLDLEDIITVSMQESKITILI